MENKRRKDSDTNSQLFTRRFHIDEIVKAIVKFKAERRE